MPVLGIPDAAHLLNASEYAVCFRWTVDETAWAMWLGGMTAVLHMSRHGLRGGYEILFRYSSGGLRVVCRHVVWYGYLFKNAHGISSPLTMVGVGVCRVWC